MLLPQPDAPSRQTNSPGATSRVTPSSATTRWLPLPNDLVTSAMDTTVRGDAPDPGKPGSAGEARDVLLFSLRSHGVIVGSSRLVNSALTMSRL